MLDPHFGRALNIPLSRAYEYYKDIEDYVQRYPRYYGSIDVIDKTENSITTRQFLNLSISVDQDHVKVDVRYTFFPLKEIQYEIIRGYDEGLLRIVLDSPIKIKRRDQANALSK